MPENQADTTTINEIANALKITKQAAIKKANKEEWPYIVLNRRGMRCFYMDELPPEIRERIVRYRYGIDEDSVEELASRFKIRVPDQKLKDPQAAMQIRIVCECLAVPTKVKGRKERIAHIAESYGFSIDTAYRFIRLVKKGKELFAATKNHGITLDGLGITLRAWDKEAAEMAVREIMANRRRHQEKLAIYERIKTEAQAAGLRVGCYESFLNLNKRIGKDVHVYRDKGIRGLREDIVPPIQRDPSSYRPMENLVGDQHKADYYCFDHNCDVATLELFCWLDFRTQMIWGAIAYKHYNRYTVGQALINAAKWGLPSIIYTDWGKPEESHYISQLIEQLTGLGIRMEGIKHTKARVKHPQAKPIESWFGWLDRNLKNDRVPGYCKRLTDARENDLQQKEIKRMTKREELLPIPDMVDRIFAVINKWNAHKFKNRREDTGLSPLDIYNNETSEHPVTTLSDDVLDYIFLPYQICKIRRSQVKIKHDWLRTITYYDPALSSLSGEEALVRYDPFNPYQSWVFVKNRLVCQAEEWGMINPKMTDRVSNKIEQQNRLIKQIREKYDAYKPKKKGIPRIGPHDREVKQIKRAQEKEVKGFKDFRVLHTNLDKIDPDTGEILEEAQVGGETIFSRMYGIDNFNKDVREHSEGETIFSRIYGMNSRKKTDPGSIYD